MKQLLDTWLTERGWGSAKRLAKASGLSPSYISELRSGKCGERLTAETAKALERGTGIKATIWLGLEPAPKPQRRASDRRKAGAA